MLIVIQDVPYVAENFHGLKDMKNLKKNVIRLVIDFQKPKNRGKRGQRRMEKNSNQE